MYGTAAPLMPGSGTLRASAPANAGAGASPMDAGVSMRRRGDGMGALAASASAADTAGFGYLPPVAGPPPLLSWLASLGLAHFYTAFLDAGFDDLLFLVDANGLSEEDLDAIGVHVPGQRRKLACLYGAAAFLPRPVEAKPAEEEKPREEEEEEEEEEDEEEEEEEDEEEDEDDDEEEDE
jgi:hypothetical protein